MDPFRAPIESHGSLSRRTKKPGPVTAEQSGALAAQRTTTLSQLSAAMMIGQMLGLHDEAERILPSLAHIVGDERQLRITLAFASAVGGDVVPAHALLKADVDEWPDGELAMLSLALALKVGRDAAWVGIVDRALAVSADEATRNFALSIRDFG